MSPQQLVTINCILVNKFNRINRCLERSLRRFLVKFHHSGRCFQGTGCTAANVLTLPVPCCALFVKEPALSIRLIRVHQRQHQAVRCDD